MATRFLTRGGPVMLILAVWLAGIRPASGETTSDLPAPPGPGHQWTFCAGFDLEDRVESVASDAERNVYVTGKSTGDVWGEWRAEPIFVAKLRAGGSLAWSFCIGVEDDGEYSAGGSHITIDPDGDLVYTGWFTDVVNLPGGGGFSIDFDPTGGEDLKNPHGMPALFVSKIHTTPDGYSYGWTRTVGTPAPHEGLYAVVQSRALETDSDGNIWVVGQFWGTVDFDPAEGSEFVRETRPGEMNAFILKLTRDGDFAWVRTFGEPYGPADGYGEAFDVAIDGTGNGLVTGCLGREAGDVPIEGWGDVDTHGGSDIFVCKLGPDGRYAWFHAIGATSDDSGAGVAVDESGEVFVTGRFRDTVDFDPGPGRDRHRFKSTAWDRDDAFVTKFSAQGEYRWTQTIGGEGDDEGRCVRIDRFGNAVVAGHFESKVDFNPGELREVRNARDGRDAFATCLAGDGSWKWVFTFGGDRVTEHGMPLVDVEEIELDAAGDLVLAGAYAGLVDFDPGEGTDNHVAFPGAPWPDCQYDAWIMKFRPVGF
ncbi:MAG: hypothetical protein HYY18_06140 [Planctomycetes bacterium]|nr:hypothetical protein [Planctomycetota bacterium]